MSKPKLEFIVLCALLGLAVLGLYRGWRLFWFLTDDAYIAFRYVSNSALGHGYVWNAPPFQPVEGYTSFLWVVLLDIIWRLTQQPPPVTANWVSLFFAALTLLLAARMVWQLAWRGRLGGGRLLLVALMLLLAVCNRNFLIWSSSGLETAMFNFFVLLWLHALIWVPHGRPAWPVSLSGAAALMALTRPDGLLFCAATGVALGLVARFAAGSFPLRRLAGAWPMLAVLAHLVGRRLFYQSWLPNTFHAKHSGVWPESGWRYLASFVLEYALWFWLAILLLALLARARSYAGAGRRGRVRVAGAAGAESLPREIPADRPGPTWLRSALIGLGAVTFLLHAAYYTFAIGGDHFEYRVYSHLILPGLILLIWAVNALRFSVRRSAMLILLFGVLSSWLPWTHWSLCRDLATRAETHQMLVPVSPHLPRLLRWYGRIFDDLQTWLIGHYVCCRHQEHKVAHDLWMTGVLPTREEGARLPAGGYPVMAYWGGIGGLAWVLPQVQFIDLFGLNDFVIARSAAHSRESRRMAHDRRPPAGYVECFLPNVYLEPGRGIRIEPRPRELTAADIIACERKWRENVGCPRATED